MNATTITWLGANGNWSDAANWDTGTVPGAGDEVVIPSGYVYLNAGGYEYAQSVEVQSPGRIYIYSGNGLSIEGSVDVEGLHNMGRVYVWGKLIIENATAPNVNYEGIGLLNEGYFYVFSNAYMSVSETEDYGIRNEGNGYFRNYGELEVVSDDGYGIDNDARFYNSGKLTVSTNNTYPNYGILNRDNFRNYSSGKILVNGGGAASFGNNFSASNLRNYGSLIVQNSEQLGINNGGTITNYAGARLESKYCGTNGVNNNPGGVITNHEDFLIYYADFAGIINKGTIHNNNYLFCYQSTHYSLKTYAGSTFENHGSFYALGQGDNDIYLDGSLYNYDDGKVFVDNGIYTTGAATVFTNDGTIVGYGDINHIIFGGSQLINNGIIEDRNANFPITVDNQQVIVEPLSGTLQNGVPYPDALNVTSLSNVTVQNWYTDIAHTAVAGTYDPVTNEFTPNANAIGLTELIVSIEINSSGFTRNYTVAVPDGIAPLAVMNDNSEANALTDTGGLLKLTDFNSETITAFPNPTVGSVNIESSLFDTNGTNVFIYNSNGKKVAQLYFEEGTRLHSVDLPSHLGSGMYTLNYVQNGQSVGMSKIQLQR